MYGEFVCPLDIKNSFHYVLERTQDVQQILCLTGSVSVTAMFGNGVADHVVPNTNFSVLLLNKKFWSFS